ncbi:hypothetical protein [Caballeronia sp. dw_19]|uniref:hypothetical protein n=1 Tax=Caballeronia sp. dw_19 TaxID=2719791 RepID=UPI001BD2EAB9|nr:hypothetical protein [Caballeronia sp. dw_19]
MKTLQDYEQVGSAFSVESMLMVRTKTRDVIHAIAARVHSGMEEEEAVSIAKEILTTHGMRRGWHEVYERFGTNTVKTFGAPSFAGMVLGENDIFLST